MARVSKAFVDALPAEDTIAAMRKFRRCFALHSSNPSGFLRAVAVSARHAASAQPSFARGGRGMTPWANPTD